MHRPGPCPRCARPVAELAAELAGEMTEGRDVLDQVAELLEEDDDVDLESPLGGV